MLLDNPRAIGRGIRWVRVILPPLAVAYAAFFVLALRASGPFAHCGADLRSYLASGIIALQHGFAAVYDLGLQLTVQQAMIAERLSFPAPTFYPPVFVLPFIPFSFMPHIWAFVTWEAFTFLGTLLYVFRFSRASGLSSQYAALVFLCYPSFSNLFWGQVNLLTLVCVCEATLCLLSGRFLQAGLWFGGLTIKPQLLVLIPFWLAWRRKRVFAGLVASVSVVALASVALAGPEGIAALASLMIGGIGGLPTNSPQMMANWRTLGLIVSDVTGLPLALPLAVVGSAVSVGVALFALGSSRQPNSELREIVIVLTASLVVAWHSHVHMALPLAPVLALAAERGVISRRVWVLWCILPASAFSAGVFLAQSVNFALHLGAQSMLLVNLAVLWMTARHGLGNRICPVWRALGSTPVIETRSGREGERHALSAKAE